MAKKISKHSRAARRGEVESQEAKELAQLPKEDTVKKSIIRNTILTENLLAKKLENKRNKNKVRKQSKNVNTSRRTNLGGVLSTKIEHSVARYNFIRNSRGVGWDKINDEIKKSTVEEKPTEKAKSLEQQEEDEYVRQFFEEETPAKIDTPQNRFAMLGDDTEA